MKVLYLTYSQQNSFESFVTNYRTGFSWVDSMIDEIVNHCEIQVGLAVPIKTGSFQKTINNGIIMYGLPADSDMTRIKRFIRRIRFKNIETNEICYLPEAIKDFNPDIIQVFGTENPLGNIVNKTNKPVIIHFQGSVIVWLVKWSAGISRYEQILYGSFKNFFLLRGSFHHYYAFSEKARRERTIMNNCRYYLGRTDFDKRLISMFSPQSKYFHCDEFIRHQFFNNHWCMPLGDTVTCISILKGVTYKGLDLLLETSGILEDYTSIAVEFKICGICDDEDIVHIMRRKYRGKINFSKFVFLGKLQTDSLIYHMCNSNLYIHPSYIENSSNSICEAMSLGMPVISTNVGGAVSLIENGVDGLLVQEGEPYSLAASINTLIKDYEYAKRLGKSAKLRSEERHKPEKLYKELLKIYEVISSKV